MLFASDDIAWTPTIVDVQCTQLSQSGIAILLVAASIKLWWHIQLWNHCIDINLSSRIFLADLAYCVNDGSGSSTTCQACEDHHMQGVFLRTIAKRDVFAFYSGQEAGRVGRKHDPACPTLLSCCRSNLP